MKNVKPMRRVHGETHLSYPCQTDFFDIFSFLLQQRIHWTELMALLLNANKCIFKMFWFLNNNRRQL